MEENRVETLSSVMKNGESHHYGVLSDIGFDNINNFDYLMKIDESEFDKFNLPVLPSLHLPSPPVPPNEIDDVSKLGVIDSISSGEMIDWGSIFTPENSTIGHTQSLFVESDFILNADTEKTNSGKRVVESNMDSLHQNNNVDDVGRSPFLVARAMPREKLAELVRTDPKKARRILANRNSAARSKERRKIYQKELESKVKSLQAQVAIVSEELLLTKRDVATRSDLNNKLRLQIEAKRQQIRQRRAAYEASRTQMEYHRMNNNQFTDYMSNDHSYYNLGSGSSSGYSMQHEYNLIPPSQHQDPMQPSISMPPNPQSIPFGQPFDEHFFSKVNFF
ncbi:unnamed protein product [Lupinus luteus]|uniref:BZIP domain-containing protein n=1 Tax=Lupinus luteus TaxID=3873 RepID=A0AAV1W1W7_LUPLU